jgi:hypothetical protein
MKRGQIRGTQVGIYAASQSGVSAEVLNAGLGHPSSISFSSRHTLSNKTEDSNGRHEDGKIVKLFWQGQSTFRI